jgi:hypothetical protein
LCLGRRKTDRGCFSRMPRRQQSLEARTSRSGSAEIDRARLAQDAVPRVVGVWRVRSASESSCRRALLPRWSGRVLDATAGTPDAWIDPSKRGCSRSPEMPGTAPLETLVGCSAEGRLTRRVSWTSRAWTRRGRQGAPDIERFPRAKDAARGLRARRRSFVRCTRCGEREAGPARRRRRR